MIDDEHWDAGDMGCGELILKLRIRVNKMSPGSVLRLTALDTGAIADIPAWCLMTKHRLLRAEHPDYWISRRDHD